MGNASAILRFLLQEVAVHRDEFLLMFEVLFGAESLTTL